jgi:hypothetical protein
MSFYADAQHLCCHTPCIGWTKIQQLMVVASNTANHGSANLMIAQRTVSRRICSLVGHGSWIGPKIEWWTCPSVEIPAIENGRRKSS